MKSERTVIGIVAHVDAGKTTLSEQILFRTGVIRKAGRVDSRDTCFDFYDQERQRGITIFSKQTDFEFGERTFTLIDTPGHVDFSAETERALSVMDAAILVVDGVEGVQSQTELWWQMLKERSIPVFIFVGKGDRNGADANRVLEDIRRRLSISCADFTTSENEENAAEDIVSLKEEWLEAYLEGNADSSITASAISECLISPVVFGSGLTGDGVERLLSLISDYAPVRDYPQEFGAVVYKIRHDSKGDRVTFLKLTGGNLSVKETIGEEKINQIRIYAGEKFSLVPSVNAGTACAVTGLADSYPGQQIGASREVIPKTHIKPPLMASVTAEGTDLHTLVKRLELLSEEMPELTVKTGSFAGQEQVQIGVMGKIQMEVVSEMLMKSYNIQVTFGECHVVYKETIKDTVVGYGHYEPLRHYAEVHVRIDPAELDSGVTSADECNTEMLDKNFRNLALTHIMEKEHIGMLTGSPLTDVKITLIAGRSHLKHTEGGDFREATYRAIRQGLEKAEMILLEPAYTFILRVPAAAVGRAINDLQKMSCSFEPPEQELDTATIKGKGPVAELMNYGEDVASYTSGKGSIIFRNAGYMPCHNSDEVIEKAGYEKDRDLENPSSSVFCSHGAGFEVKWQDVDSFRHIKE